MPDISMCGSETCRRRETCYRNTASGTKPSEWRQLWSSFPDDTGLSPCYAYDAVVYPKESIEVLKGMLK